MASSTVFFAKLSEADRDVLAGRWAVRRYRRDELVIAHEDTGRDVFFVLEGRARATLFSEGGRAVAYRDIECGDIFGELAAIDGKARSASVVALEPLSAARLPEAAFREIVDTRPTFTWALMEHLSGQMRRMTERVYEFSTLVVRKRLIRELLRLAGDQGDKAFVTPAPTHFALAAMISTHREAVSREMSSLAKRGLIEKRGATLILLEPDILRSLAEAEEKF
jgi:CRP/FNR family cyclic AMP-dependent transcriptional regulator